MTAPSRDPARLDALAEAHELRAVTALETAETCDPNSYPQIMWQAIARQEESRSVELRASANAMRAHHAHLDARPPSVWVVFEPDEDEPATTFETKPIANRYVAMRTGRVLGPFDCSVLGRAEVDLIARINEGL